MNFSFKDVAKVRPVTTAVVNFQKVLQHHMWKKALAIATSADNKRHRQKKIEEVVMGGQTDRRKVCNSKENTMEAKFPERVREWINVDAPQCF